MPSRPSRRLMVSLERGVMGFSPVSARRSRPYPMTASGRSGRATKERRKVLCGVQAFARVVCLLVVSRDRAHLSFWAIVR